MDGGLFVFGIVIVVMATGIIKQYLRAKQYAPSEDPKTQSRMEALERRIQTLERIVTDKGYDLKGEFDKL